MNLYGFANGDPVNFSDPFGLCPEEEKKDGECPEDSIVTVSANVSGAVGVGGNAEVGVIINQSTGDKSLFAKAGMSFGLGFGVGGEVTGQRGSIESALGLPDGSRQTAGEFEASFGLLGLNVVMDDVGSLPGGGINAGAGKFFVGINTTQIGGATPRFSFTRMFLDFNNTMERYIYAKAGIVR